MEPDAPGTECPPVKPVGLAVSLLAGLLPGALMVAGLYALVPWLVRTGSLSLFAAYNLTAMLPLFLGIVSG